MNAPPLPASTAYAPEIVAAAARLNIRPEAVKTYLDAGRGVRATGVERTLHATVKPIGSACNLDCPYCYYLSKEALLEQKTRRITDAVLEQYIVEYIASQDAREVAFTWHGGEPTLLGLDFFRKVVALQAKHAPPGRTIVNDLQTNGTLLDDAWAAFLKANGFVVGLSVDGPRELHDAFRPMKARRTDPSKRGSFDKVMEGARALQRHGVTFGALTVVNRENAKRPLEVYRFLRDDLGARYMQFLPCVEPRAFETIAPGHLPEGHLTPAGSARARPEHPMSIVTPWTVDADDWGTFLSAVFDEWYAHDRGRVKVNLFESMFAQLHGRPSMLCTSSPVCGKNVAVEHDGRIYACDHYVYPEYEIGRLGETSLAAAVFSLPQLEFGLAKHNTLPGACRECPYLRLCWGECPRTRLLRTREEDGTVGKLSYLCSGWKLFYGHVVPQVTKPARTARTGKGSLPVVRG